MCQDNKKDEKCSESCNCNHGTNPNNSFENQVKKAISEMKMSPKLVSKVESPTPSKIVPTPKLRILSSNKVITPRLNIQNSVPVPIPIPVPVSNSSLKTILTSSSPISSSPTSSSPTSSSPTSFSPTSSSPISSSPTSSSPTSSSPTSSSPTSSSPTSSSPTNSSPTSSSPTNLQVPIKRCNQVGHQKYSKYPVDNVPLTNFMDSKGKELKTCIDCRNFINARNRERDKTKKEEAKKNLPKENLPGYRTCNNLLRHRLNSKLPIDKVPIENFEDLERKGKYYDNCIDCRKYSYSTRQNGKNRKKEEIKKANTDPNFRMCISSLHAKVSEYPVEKVPIQMFYNTNKTNIDKGEIVFCDECSDCRSHIYKTKAKYKKRLEEEAVKNNLWNCSTCYRSVPLKDMHYNEEKEKYAKYCKNCAQKYIIHNKKVKGKLRETYYKIIEERVLQHGASCQRCKFIFLKPEEGTKYVVQLATYEKNDKRYLDYKGVTYEVSNFLSLYIHLVDFRIIDFDHLTEAEQRQRGILKENEVYEPKQGCVSRMNSEAPMRKESKKCEILCCRCHTIVTNERRGFRTLSTELLKRKAYVDSIKCKGCEVCGFYDPNPYLQGFIEMDHKDPSTKKEGVANLMNGLGSFEDLVEECAGCGPKCRFCHRIHSCEQRKQGII